MELKGFDFEAIRVQMVWNRGFVITGSDPTVWRMDRFGNLIARDEYGKYTAYGWQIDHTIPRSRGGPDTIDNLEPVHWKANLAKSDSLI